MRAVEQNQRDPYKRAHLTQRLLLMLTISNLLGFKGLVLLFSPLLQCPVSIVLPFS
jgi:hypothetical protein